MPAPLPSLVQPRLCRSHQVICKYVFSVLPLPAFDFFLLRDMKGPNQPYICLKSKEKNLCI